MQSASFDPRKRRLWCHGPKPEYALDADWSDQWYIPARTLALVRPGLDVIILPSGHRPTREFAEFCTRVLGLGADQMLWTSGTSYLLDDDIVRELRGRLRALVDPAQWEVVPYAATEPFLRWAEELRVPVLGEDAERARRVGHKGILHPNAIPALRDPAWPILPDEIAGLRVARGYTCTTAEELLRAYTLLSAVGVHECLVKPVVGTTGEGILPVREASALETYAFPMGSVVLEERLVRDTDENGRIRVTSVQYRAGRLWGEPTDQTIRGVAYEGNLVPSAAPQTFQEELQDMARRIIERLALGGIGGFDFLSVGGSPVLVDPNIGRCTGVFGPRVFRDLYAPGRPFACWKIVPEGDVWTFWAALQRKGIAFDPRAPRTGVFPLCHLAGVWGQFLAIGETRADLWRLRREAEECL